MAKVSSVRRLLRCLSFEEVKCINEFYSLPPRKSKEHLVEQVVRHCKRDLSQLVSKDGPYLLARWNELAVELGGSARKSFEIAAAEIERRLDPIFDDLDGDTTVAALRNDKGACSFLAVKLRLSRDDLSEQLKRANGKLRLSKFIIPIREVKLAEARAIRLADRSPLRLASTRLKNPTIEKLNHEWMKGELAEAQSLDIAAGFYDLAFIDELLKSNAQIQKVRLIFNGLGGRRLRDQSKELIEYRQGLLNLDNKIDIRLAFAPGLFHSKLFLISGPNQKRALVGSANATTAAFARNEEILLSLTREIEPLFNYFETAWENAKPLGQAAMSSKTLVSFFRTGVMYFKPNESISFTINPFLELINRLTDDQKSQLGSVPLPHADVGTGIGPFSLRRAAQSEVASNLNGVAIEIAEKSSEKSNRVSIKKYSIETCYGYWVPSALDDELNEMLKKVGEAKKIELERLRDQLEEIGETKLSVKYREYVDAAKIAFFQAGLEGLLGDLLPDPFSNSTFVKFYDRTMRHLFDDQKIERLSRPFISGSVPELWDDSLAYEDFKSTFFDYVSLIGKRSTKPFVPAQILNRLNLEQPLESDELSDLFEQSIANEPWGDEDWTRIKPRMRNLV